MEQGVIKYPTFGVIGALFVTLAIGLGAYGAHGLEDAFSKTPRMERAWGNAVDYQMFHGLALFVLGIVRIDQKRAKLWMVSGILMSLGVILFLFQYLCMGIWRTGRIDYGHPLWWIFIYHRLGLACDSSIPQSKALICNQLS